MSRPVDEILAPKPLARLHIFAYSPDDKAHTGLLKVGQTACGVKACVAEHAHNGRADQGHVLPNR
jgi:hypothetical protein